METRVAFSSQDTRTHTETLRVGTAESGTSLRDFGKTYQLVDVLGQLFAAGYRIGAGSI